MVVTKDESLINMLLVTIFEVKMFLDNADEMGLDPTDVDEALDVIASTLAEPELADYIAALDEDITGLGIDVDDPDMPVDEAVDFEDDV